MVKLIKLIGYIVFFIAALVFFVPKTSFYYYAEKELKKEKIIFSNEEVIDNKVSLNLKNVSVSYDSIHSADVEDINLKMFLFYNSVSIKNIKLTEIASSFIPLEINNIEITYSIFNPLYVVAVADGKFGEINAELHLLDRNASLILKPSEVMHTRYKKTLGMLKKNSQGGYEYAKKF